VQTTLFFGAKKGFSGDGVDAGKPRVQLESFTGSRSIAKELRLSVKTISSYRAIILLKTRMKNNAEITHYAIRNKLVD